MLEIKNLNIKIQNTIIVENLSFTLNEGDKLAIIGEEGNGKSTILKAILNDAYYATVTGIINYKNSKIGYLKQNLEENELEKDGFSYLFNNQEDYYQKINEFYRYLKKINLQEGILTRKLKSLSGGEKVKISLLKLFLDDVDIFFLDEPTNDLDLETLLFLENFLQQTSKPLLYVSHDEMLLSKTANMILHLERVKDKKEARHTIKRIGYEEYIKERLHHLEKEKQIARNEKREYQKKEAILRKHLEKVAYYQETITRSDPHGGRLLKKKMHALKSQEKKLQNEKPREEIAVLENINFFFEPVFIPKSKQVLKIQLAKLQVENKILSKNINFEVIGPLKVGIIGKNGVGKTTFLKEIFTTLKMRSDLKVGYMPQVYEEVLNNYSNAIDFLTKDKTKESLTKSRMYLGNMNFTREEMDLEISKLSNGSKAQLCLLELLLSKYNVLLLDEPTRNMSPLANPIIRTALKEFQGAIISISHDRKYLQEVMDEIYLLDELGLRKIEKRDLEMD